MRCRENEQTPRRQSLFFQPTSSAMTTTLPNYGDLNTSRWQLLYKNTPNSLCLIDLWRAAAAAQCRAQVGSQYPTAEESEGTRSARARGYRACLASLGYRPGASAVQPGGELAGLRRQVTAAGARRSGPPGLRCGPPLNFGVAFPNDLRQRGIAIDDAFIEAQQGSEAGTPARYVNCAGADAKLRAAPCLSARNRR
jgi:hypothetical protein